MPEPPPHFFWFPTYGPMNTDEMFNSSGDPNYDTPIVVVESQSEFDALPQWVKASITETWHLVNGTTCRRWNGTEFHYAVVLINEQYNDFGECGGSYVPIRAVLGHELGHAQGMNHPYAYSGPDEPKCNTIMDEGPGESVTGCPTDDCFADCDRLLAHSDRFALDCLCGDGTATVFVAGGRATSGLSGVTLTVSFDAPPVWLRGLQVIRTRDGSGHALVALLDRDVGNSVWQFVDPNGKRGDRYQIVATGDGGPGIVALDEVAR